MTFDSKEWADLYGEWDTQLNEPDPEEEIESVELIASGYEWICPACEEINKEIEVNVAVTCKFCQNTYHVDDYHHAIG